MVITNYGRERTAVRIGSQVDHLGSAYMAVGSGSGVVTVATTGLYHYFDRNQITGSPDMTTAQKLVWVADFTNSEMSGLTLRQFGMFVESSGGKAWHVENVIPTTFNGTQELNLEVTWKVV